MRAPLQLIIVLAALVLGNGLLLGSILLVDTPAAHAQSTLTPGSCGEQGTLDSRVAQGTLPSGALYLICIPATGWNGDLVVYAHGYTPVTAPLDFQNAFYISLVAQNRAGLITGQPVATISPRRRVISREWKVFFPKSWAGSITIESFATPASRARWA
jgi:hypothetical protein